MVTVLSHDTRKNMKRIGIKGSHLVFNFNFGERNSPKMIYKTNSIFPFQMIIGRKKGFLAFLKFRTLTGNPKETKTVSFHVKVPALCPHLPRNCAPRKIAPEAVLRVAVLKGQLTAIH